MAIRMIKIQNFKSFKGPFSLQLGKGVNILVGDNEAGKSTILEALHLALTGIYCGRSIRNELSQYLFNNESISEYLQSIRGGTPIAPPTLLIEIYFDGSIDPELFEGNANTESINRTEGVQFKIAFDEKYSDEYQAIIENKELDSLPIEYYEASWTTFARQTITTKSIPIKSVIIDSSNYRYQNGSDMYISRIIKSQLTPKDIITVAQAHRNMVGTFAKDESIKTINTQIASKSTLVKGNVSLAVDFGSKNAWESSLVAQVDSVPFGFIGKGSQCIIKTELALDHKQAQNAGVILLEEPESHLSFSNLNQLIDAISKKCDTQQILMSTHSSYVANKLGLENLIFLNDHEIVRLSELPSASFFRKMAGYDTLRLILCRKAILVEGDSDELVLQKAYMKTHEGRLPIQDGIDVISVGTSFLRFLEIADRLHKTIAVVTDNDGDVAAVEKKYKDYTSGENKGFIGIFYDRVVDEGELRIGKAPYNYNTLEPKMLKVNNLTLFNEIFETNYKTEDELRKYMKCNKTECALAIFDTEKDIQFPEYIIEAINHVE